nr:hypothetical protein [uncultured Celeribacter sp.]
MKKNIVMGAVFACLAPSIAAAEMTTTSSLWVGYVDDGYGNSGEYVTGDFDLKGSYDVGAGVKAGLDVGFNLTYDGATGAQLEGALDDYTVSLDFGRFGKLSYTSEQRCDTLPYFHVDGHVKRPGELYDGATPVNIAVVPKYRCVGTGAALINAGNGAPGILLANDYLKYENQFGAWGVEAYYDHNLAYDDVSGDDAATLVNFGDMPAQAEITLRYSSSFGIYSASVNDLGDFSLIGVLPLPKAGLTFVAFYEKQNTDGNDELFGVNALWQSQNTGIFRGLHGLYMKDEVEDKLILQANFGADNWNFSVVGDSDGDYAMEGAYQLSERAWLTAGYGSSFEAGDGFDLMESFPPTAAASRDAAFEIGLRVNL